MFCLEMTVFMLIREISFISLYLIRLDVAYVKPVIVCDGSNGKERQTLIDKAPQTVNMSVIKPLAIKCC